MTASAQLETIRLRRQSRSGKQGLDHLGRFGDGFRKLVNIFTTGLGHIRAAPASSADHRCKVFDNIAGFNLFGEVLGDADAKGDLAFSRGAKNNNAGAELVAQGVKHGTQALGVLSVDLDGEQLEAFNFLDVAHVIGSGAGGGRLFPFVDFACEALVFFEEGQNAFAQIIGVGAQELGGGSELALRA